MLKLIFGLFEFNLTQAAAVGWGAAAVGVLIVLIGALAAFLFVRFMMWWWDQ